MTLAFSDERARKFGLKTAKPRQNQRQNRNLFFIDPAAARSVAWIRWWKVVKASWTVGQSITRGVSETKLARTTWPKTHWPRRTELGQEMGSWWGLVTRQRKTVPRYRIEKKKQKKKTRQETLTLEFCYFCYTLEPCLTATSLPLFFWLPGKNRHTFSCKKALVHTATPLIRPIFLAQWWPY